MEGCKEAPEGRDLCHTHYERWRRNGTTTLIDTTKEHCVRGHELTAKGRYKSGKCRKCVVLRTAAYYRANPEKRRERQRRWRKANPDKYRADMVWRGLGGKDDETVAYLAAIRADPCCYCGAVSTDVDHIIPVASGGVNHWTNYTRACRSCNARKQASSLLIFLANKAR